MPTYPSVRPIVILLVDSGQILCHKIIDQLSFSGFSVALHQVNSENTLAAGMGKQPDVVLANLAKAEIDGLRILERVRSIYPIVPVIFLGRLADEESALECLDHGAADVLLGSSLKRLGHIVRRAVDERQRIAEQGVSESEERYRSIVENATVGIVVHVDGAIVYGNRAILNLIGADQIDTILGKQVLDFVHPEDRPMIMGLIQRAIMLAQPVEVDPPMVVEERLTRIDGRVITVEAAAILINYYGKPGLLVMMTDITQRKQAEEALRNRERQLDQIIQQMPLPVGITDPNGVTRVTNQAFLEMFHIPSADAVVGKFNFLTDPWMLRSGVVDRAKPAYQGQVVFLPDVTVQTGRLDPKYQAGEQRTMHHEITIFPVFNIDHQLSQVVMIWKDVRERIEAEAAIRASEERFRTLFETMAQGVTYHDTSGRLISANPAALRILGAPIEKLKGHHVSEDPSLLINEDGSRFLAEDSPVLKALRTGKEVRGVVLGVLNPQNGKFRWILTSAVPQFRLGEDTPFQVFTTLEEITTLRETEAALRQSNQMFEAMIQASPVAISVTDREFKLKVWSPAAERMFGWTAAEMVGKESPMFHLTGGEKIKRDIEEEFQGVTRMGIEAQRMRKDGVLIDVSLSTAPVRNREGEITGSMAMMTDITRQKIAERDLRESEARLKLAQQVGGMGSFEWDMTFNQILLSEQLEVIFGQRAGAQDFQSWIGMVHPDDREKVERSFLEAIQDHRAEVSVEYRIVRANGEERWVDSRSVLAFDDDGGPARITGVVLDVTTQKEAVHQLQESEALFRAIFESAAVGIVLVDAKTGYPIRTNAIFQEMLGYSAAELEKKTISDFSHPDDMLVEAQLYQEMLAGKRSQYQIEKRFIGKSGRTFWVRLNVSPVQSTGSRWMGIGIVEDITARKTAEELLRQQMEENYKRKQELEAIVGVSTAVRRAETRPEMVDLLVTKSIAVMEAQAGALALVNGTSLVFQAAVGQIAGWNGKTIPQDQSIFWQVIQEGIPRFTGPDTPTENRYHFLSPMQAISPDISAGIFTPLLSGETTIGLLFLGYVSPNSFSGTQIRLAVAIAELAGNALHRMSIAEALEQMVAERTRDLETIYQVAAASREKADLGVALQSTLLPILNSVASQIGSIIIVDEKTKKTMVLAAHGLPPQIQKYIEEVDDQNSIEHWVIKQKLPLILPDLTADPRAAGMGRSPVPLPFVALPMRVGERIVGILEIARIGGSPFDLEELTLLFFIADHLGLLVENTTLLHRAEQHAILAERSRLARELHDSITQLLYSATLYAEGSYRLADRGDLPQLMAKLADLSQITQQALKEMRLMVYELRSQAFRSDGLVKVIQHRLESVELRGGIQASLNSDPLPPLPERLEEALYRIALEALNNSLKHASAKNVEVVIRNTGAQIVLSVKDDGRGFILTESMHQGGMGMTSMQERADSFNGSLHVRSEPGGGTEVEVILPYTKKTSRARSDKGKNR
jgi:PAS domain S-box-containing protein